MPTQAQIAAKQAATKAAAKGKGLNAAQAAVLAAGGDMDAVLALADEGEVEGELEEDPAKASTEVPEDEPTLTIEAATAKIAELEAAAATAEAAASETLAAMTAKFDTATASLTAAQEESKALAAALTPYVTRMSVALGTEAKTGTHAELLAAHADLKPKFAASFQAGRQSKTAASTTQQSKQTGLSSDILAAASALKL